MRLDGVFRNEKLLGDLAIAEALGDKGENLEFPRRDAEGLLVRHIGSKGLEVGGFRRNEHFLHHDRFTDGFATARDAETKPDTEGSEQNGDKGSVELDGVLDDDEAVFGVLEGGDEKAADETEDKDMALHAWVAKKYNGDGAVGASGKTTLARPVGPGHARKVQSRVVCGKGERWVGRKRDNGTWRVTSIANAE